ncbi:MAG: hypothetical protein H7210_03710 [Pyrinomonadaceae bacterium]|nr:hypothetical protein [Phycisphaerales bacterium]
MPLSSKRKVSFAALGLMVAALGVDRFVLGPGGPQTAAASLPEQFTVLPSTSLAMETSGQGAHKSITSRLDELRVSLKGADHKEIDLFHATPEWLAPLPDQKTPVGQQAASVVDLTADFASKHRLTSVMMMGKNAMVVIDGVSIKQGEVFDGLRLVKVEQGAAVFEDGVKRVRLAVDSVFDRAVTPPAK